MEKAALASIGMVYRGAFDFGHRYWRGQSMWNLDGRETTYWAVDGRDGRNGIDDSERDCFLLPGLTASCRYPAQDDAIRGVNSCRECTHGKVPGPNV